jgi:metal transporter CNNM
VVVPAASKAPPTVLKDSWGLETTRWTGTERTNNRIKSKLKASKAKFDWTIDFLRSAELNADDSLLRRHRIHGIRAPKPIGIITFEDIIDTILQKTSRDENDFFDRNNSTPPTKGKKAGDYSPPRPVIGGIAPNSSVPIKPSKGHLSQKSKDRNTLRKRKPSIKENPANLDGADDRSRGSSSSGSMRQQKTRKDFVESSYTLNSQGGFHGAHQSDSWIYPAVMLSMMTSEDLAELANTSSSECPDNPYSPTKTTSLPSRKSRSPLATVTRNTMRRVSAAPTLPSVRRVTPFSRNTSSFERSEDAKQIASDLVMPAPSMTPVPATDSSRSALGRDDSGIDIYDSITEHIDFANDPDCEMSSSLIALNTSDEEENDEVNSALYNAFPVPASGQERHEWSLSRDLNTIEEAEQKKPYDGFPPELLEVQDENRISNYDSKTMPRLPGSFELETRSRERSFHDDRAMLPSQRKAMQGENVVIGARSSSLWW